eukprot:g8470.t1
MKQMTKTFAESTDKNQKAPRIAPPDMGLWRFSQAETKLVAVIGGTVQVAPAAPQRDWLNSFSSSSRETAPPVHLNEQAGMVAPKPAEARVRSSSPHTFPLLRRPGSLLVQGTSPRPFGFSSGAFSSAFSTTNGFEAADVAGSTASSWRGSFSWKDAGSALALLATPQTAIATTT